MSAAPELPPRWVIDQPGSQLITYPEMDQRMCRCGCGETSRWSGAGRPPAVLADRFWASVSIGQGDECWPWSGGRNSKGYGRLGIHGRTVNAHRVAFILAHGAIEPDLVVRHSCDNPPCCNPAHLLSGTSQDNSDDAAERGLIPRGERAGRAVLTELQIREIRAMRSGGALHKDIARRFGVARSTIQAICSGKTWGWLP